MNCFALGLAAVQLSLAAPGAAVSSLPAARQDIFGRIASEEYCSCSSALTLAGCLDKRPTCRLAGHLQDILVRALQLGAPQAALEGFMSQEVLGPFCAPPLPLKVEQAPHKGKTKAPITMVEFADFRCSHCRHAVPLVHKAIQTYSNKVQLWYVPISLQGNEMSNAAAEAAMAAHAQGKFWEMHAALFAREAGDFTPEVLAAIAKEVGLDMKQFDKDTASHRFRETLAGWKKLSLDAGVTGTPAFFVNGRHFNPTPEVVSLEQRFEMELDRDQPECK